MSVWGVPLSQLTGTNKKVTFEKITSSETTIPEANRVAPSSLKSSSSKSSTLNQGILKKECTGSRQVIETENNPDIHNSQKTETKDFSEQIKLSISNLNHFIKHAKKYKTDADNGIDPAVNYKAAMNCYDCAAVDYLILFEIHAETHEQVALECIESAVNILGSAENSLNQVSIDTYEEDTQAIYHRDRKHIEGRLKQTYEYYVAYKDKVFAG